jgi:formylglycine-generating enzyme required for sulfatase activity/energy-coupling factor transporter ATP-binding protein EcfA2
MTKTPDDIQRQIDQLEAMRAVLGDTMVNAAIAKLRGQVQFDLQAQSTATTRDNYGQNIGQNFGVVQQFFGERELGLLQSQLADYLFGLRTEVQQLRLSHLMTKSEIRHEHSIVTPRLEMVYTDLHLNQGVPVSKAIRNTKRLVLLGETGSGKSTVLRYLAYQLAEDVLEQIDKWPDWEDKESDSAVLIPIFCPLAKVATFLIQYAGDGEKALWTLLSDTFDDVRGSRIELRNHLKDMLRRGQVILLFDGLDELPAGGDNPREKVSHAIRSLASGDAAKSPIVITSRTKPYYASEIWQMPAAEGWQVQLIAPLSSEQMRHFIQQWYRELGSTLDDSEERAEQLIAALSKATGLRLQELVESPLLLTMLVILHYNCNELPTDRVEVYERFVELLLDLWEPRRTPGVIREGLLARLAIPGLKLEQLREELHKLALQAQEEPPTGDGRGMLDRYMLTGRLLEFFSRLRCPDPLVKVNVFIDGLVQEAGLLEVTADDRYAFIHLTFQEYLAACGLANQTDMVRTAYNYWTGSDATRWREVLLLMAGRLRFLGGRPAQREGIPWLWHLLKANVKGKEKTATQRAQDAALAVLSYQELGEQEVLDEEDLNNLLLEGIVDLLATPESGVVLDERLRAGALLADLGDPRYPVSLDKWQQETTQRNETFGAPNGYWCYVRPGTYQIGGWDEGDKSADHDLPAFWIARYPVTVAQYAAFIDDGGYQQKDYWTPEGWKWKQERDCAQPYRWGDAQYNRPNQAVIGVTWYECMAFSAWLTTQLADTGCEICLPTEAEWEAAAAYDTTMQRHTYPWGDKPEPTLEHAIFADDYGNALNAPAPVGMCPSGAAACGVFDLGGQVWEWTSSSYSVYPQDADQSQGDFATDDGDVPRRGGSWQNRKASVRCGARLRLFPDLASLDNGFRLVLRMKDTKTANPRDGIKAGG